MGDNKKYQKKRASAEGFDRPGELDSIPQKTADETLTPDSSDRNPMKPANYHSWGYQPREETNNPCHGKGKK